MINCLIDISLDGSL